MNEREFELLWDSARPTLARLATKLANGFADDAQDLLQDAAVRMWEKRSYFDAGKGVFVAWASSILIRAHWNLRRQRQVVTYSLDSLNSDAISELAAPRNEDAVLTLVWLEETLSAEEFELVRGLILGRRIMRWRSDWG